MGFSIPLDKDTSFLYILWYSHPAILAGIAEILLQKPSSLADPIARSDI